MEAVNKVEVLFSPEDGTTFLKGLKYLQMEAWRTTWSSIGVVTFPGRILANRFYGWICLKSILRLHLPRLMYQAYGITNVNIDKTKTRGVLITSLEGNVSIFLSRLSIVAVSHVPWLDRNGPWSRPTQLIRSTDLITTPSSVSRSAQRTNFSSISHRRQLNQSTNWISSPYHNPFLLTKNPVNSTAATIFYLPIPTPQNKAGRTNRPAFPS